MPPGVRGAIHPPSHTPADKNAQRGRDGQIDPHREGQRRNPTQFEHQGDHHADEHQVPRQLAIQNALDDVAHQHGFRRIILGDRGPTGQFGLGSRDGRIHQPNSLARIIDQPLPRHAVGIGLMPHAVFLGIHSGHRPDEMGTRRVDQRRGRGHQARGDIRGPNMDRSRVVHGQQHPTHHHRRSEGSNQDGQLLIARRATDEKPGLQVLRSGAAIGTGDAHDAAHRERGHIVRRTRPPDGHKGQAREQERGDGHARDGVGTGTHFTGQSRGHRHKEESQHQDQRRAQEVHAQRRSQRDRRHQHEHPANHPTQGQVPITPIARSPSPSFAGSGQIRQTRSQRPPQRGHGTQ